MIRSKAYCLKKIYSVCVNIHESALDSSDDNEYGGISVRAWPPLINNISQHCLKCCENSMVIVALG